MIYIDGIADYGYKGRWCHMVSDTSTEELLDFARQIGLKPEWLQKPGTLHEHFDLRPTKRELALKFGAQEVSYQGLVAAMRRRQMGEAGQMGETDGK